MAFRRRRSPTRRRTSTRRVQRRPVRRSRTTARRRSASPRTVRIEVVQSPVNTGAVVAPDGAMLVPKAAPRRSRF